MVEMRSRASEAGRFLKSLSNEHRLLILCSLSEGEKSVGELERLLEMRQPHLSQHLTRLRESGLVTTRRVSRTVYYRLGSEPAQRMIGLLYELFCAKDAGTSSATDGPPQADDTTNNRDDRRRTALNTAPAAGCKGDEHD